MVEPVAAVGFGQHERFDREVQFKLLRAGDGFDAEPLDLVEMVGAVEAEQKRGELLEVPRPRTV